MIIDRLDIGGAERVALTLAKGYLEMQCTVTIVTIDNIVKMEVDPKINLYSLKFKKSVNQYKRNEKRLYKLLADIQSEIKTFDFIIVHLYKASRLMKAYQKVPCLHVVHGMVSLAGLGGHKGLVRLKKLYRLRKTYSNLNLVCVSEGVKNDLLEVIKVKPQSICIIHNPFIIDNIRQQAQGSLNLPFKEEYILFLGRLSPEKRVPMLIEAYIKSGIEEKLLIAGNGDEKEHILKKIEHLALKERVFVTEYAQNPYVLIQHAKLLVLASSHEGFGNVLAEALILQTPAISTYCSSGPKEILEHYTLDALVNDVESVDALAEKIRKFTAEPKKVDKNCMNHLAHEAICQAYIKQAQLLS